MVQIPPPQPKKRDTHSGVSFLLLRGLEPHSLRYESDFRLAECRANNLQPKRKGLRILFATVDGTKQGVCRAESRRRRQTTMRLPSVVQIPPPQPKTKAVHWTAFSFLERCVPQAERDAHFVRDDGFAL